MDYIEKLIDRIREWVRRLIEALGSPDQQPEPEPVPIPVDDWMGRR